jgi:hypothetical protein
MDYEKVLKSVLTEVCDAKLDHAINDVLQTGDVVTKESIHRIVKRYLELVKQELGL